jgi:hypothetical protein
MNAMRVVLAVLLLSTALSAQSAEMVKEIAAAKPGVFHHLDAAGRNSLAISGASVALVWEDNRSGAPGCYLALKDGGENTFHEFPFGRGECFEPAISALDADRFLLIWEDAAGVNVAVADIAGPGLVTRLADSGGQGNVTFHSGRGAHAVWSAPEGRWRRVFHATLSIDGKRVRAGPAQPVDAVPATDDQTYPVIAAGAQSLVLVWEDRRHGHTVIYGSFSSDPDAKIWSAPARVSGNPTGKAQGNLGRGTGAMRPALAAFGNRVAAAWLDKRDFLSGYDVYAALTDNGNARFAKDQKAQDSFGDAIAQWHVAAAGNLRGDLIIAWDDDRDGTSDIWLTRLTTSGYSENFTLPAASGPSQQVDPAIALDAASNLHLVWVERDASGATRLLYTKQPLTK